MQVSGFVSIFTLGVFGGFLGESIKWYRIRERRTLPHYLKSPFYWSVTLIVILSGGVLAALYGTEPKNALLVVNIGITAPLIIQSMAQAKMAINSDNKFDNTLNSDAKIAHYLLPNISLIKLLSGNID